MSGWMVGEWYGDGSELANAQLNLHQDRWLLCNIDTEDWVW